MVSLAVQLLLLVLWMTGIGSASFAELDWKQERGFSAKQKTTANGGGRQGKKMLAFFPCSSFFPYFFAHSLKVGRVYIVFCAWHYGFQYSTQLVINSSKNSGGSNEQHQRRGVQCRPGQSPAWNEWNGIFCTLAISKTAAAERIYSCAKRMDDACYIFFLVVRLSSSFCMLAMQVANNKLESRQAPIFFSWIRSVKTEDKWCYNMTCTTEKYILLQTYRYYVCT